jgi:soluble lytic murein transglycosylase
MVASQGKWQATARWLFERRRNAARSCGLIATLAVLVLPPGPNSAAKLFVPPPAATPPSSVSQLFEAVSRCRSSLPENDRWRIAGVIQQESHRYGYDPLLVLAMVEVESQCLPTARGPHGGIGLIQVKPSTARAIADDAGISWHGPQMLQRPVFNVKLGLHYLRQLQHQFSDPYLAMAAYNLGPARVARMPRHRARHATYVRKIMTRYGALRAQQTVGHS